MSGTDCAPGTEQPGKVCICTYLGVPHGPSEVLLCTPRLCNCGGSLAGSCSTNLSFILSSWAGAHQIAGLPFITLSLIGIILGEEIRCQSPPPHSQPKGLIDRHTPTGAGRGGQEAGHLWEGREPAFLVGEAKEGACMWKRKEISRIFPSPQVTTREGQSAQLSTPREPHPPPAPTTSRQGSIRPFNQLSSAPKQRKGRLPRAAGSKRSVHPPCSQPGPHC